jgi:nickel-dependent lactate racemase
MNITLQYGREPLVTDLPDDAEVAAPARVPKRNEGEVIAAALAHPVNGPTFDEFLAAPGPLLVVVNDGARPTPTARILKHIGARLPADARLVVATGNHEPPTAAELEFIFGPFLPQVRDRLHIHRSRDEAAHVTFGVTPRGTDVRFDRVLAEAERVLIFGSLEPHYFAGYTGGRKAFLPGVAGRETILANHQHALHPGSAPGALAGNPVHEDMLDACALVTGKTILSLQIVLDDGGDIYAATAGDLTASFEAALAHARAVYEIPIAAPADIVVTVSPPPLDATLYQAHKAIENAKGGLKPGGLMILVAPCREGVGDDEFLQVMKHFRTPAELLAHKGMETHGGWHKAVKIAELAAESELWAVTDMDAGTLAAAFMKSYRDLPRALADARAARPGARILVMTNGSMSVPRPPQL